MRPAADPWGAPAAGEANFLLDKRSVKIYTEYDLQGGAQFPTGGTVREPFGPIR